MVKSGDIEVKSPISEESLNALVNGINGVRKSPQKTTRHSVLKKNAENKSFDTNILRIPDSPTISSKSEVYSYGRRDSLNRTRFLLVRTSSGQGKESFKRVTLPGGSTVESLKFTIEKAMKTGRVSKVLVLPSKTPIERNEQICELTDSQKVEVTFEKNDWLERPRHSPTEKTFCEKKLNGKVARWSGSEELESNEAAEKTIIANGQRHTLAEKFRISNGFSNAPKEPLAECSFILPSFNQHAIIIFKTIVSSSTSLNLMAPSQNAETEEAERKQTSECSLDKSEVKINLNCIVQSTSEITKEAHRLMNGGDVHETNQKAVGLLSFFGNKAVDEQVGDVAEEFKLAHVILIVAGIGGAIGIGYYFYSRYK